MISYDYLGKPTEYLHGKSPPCFFFLKKNQLSEARSWKMDKHLFEEFFDLERTFVESFFSRIFGQTRFVRICPIKI